jgi:hypothetical protein
MFWFLLWIAGCFAFVMLMEEIDPDPLGDNTLLAPAWPIFVPLVLLMLLWGGLKSLMKDKKKSKKKSEKLTPGPLDEPLESHEAWVKRTGIKIDLHPPKKTAPKKRKK